MFLNLSVVSALELSNIRAEDVTGTSAVVKWETDQAADSFVDYKTNSSEFIKVGDASSTNSHYLAMDQLSANTLYYFQVTSGDVIDNNSGNLYTFTTLAPDILAPELKVNLSEYVAGSMIEISGWTEVGSQVSLKVNDQKSGEVSAVPLVLENGSTSPGDQFTGQFKFVNVELQPETINTLDIMAIDKAGNNVSWNGSVFADTHKPSLELSNVSSITDQSSILLDGTISENSSYDISVNNRSVRKGEGTTINDSVPLTDGKNLINIKLKDRAGWEKEYQLEVFADTKPLTVRAELEKGYEYFEGRAESTIHGETKPGSTVYLYVYKVIGNDFHPDFKRDARAKVVADGSGNFSFNDVNFAQLITDMSLKDFGPREVPSNLLEVSTYPISEVAQQQYSTYSVYIIVESPTGKTNYWQHGVTVQTCYSGLVFSVESIDQFQGPLRLIPSLMDAGRQEIQAAFELKYLGAGMPKVGTNGEVIEPGFQISSVQFEPACTANMKKNEDKFGLGCKIFPQKYHAVPSGDKTKIYVTWTLQSAKDWSKAETSYWDQFHKSQIVFPLKVTVNYQEREGTDTWSASQTQTACYDLGYFVDVPIDSSDMIPDFLADEGVQTINWTIEKIDQVSGYVKDAYLVAGVACMSASTLKTAMRWVRIFTAKVEAYYSTVKKLITDDDGKSCRVDQSGMYLDGDLRAWGKMSNYGAVPVLGSGDKLSQGIIDAIDGGEGSNEWKEVSLNTRCPKTAGMWKAEAMLDQAYRWVCDRAFCRTVPARWTEDKPLQNITQRILEQKQCAATAKGLVIEKVENCGEYVKKNVLLEREYITLKSRDEVNGKTSKDICYKYEGALYYIPYSLQNSNSTLNGIWSMYPIGPDGISNFQVKPDQVLVYNPSRSTELQDFIAAREVMCKTLCERKIGYTSINNNLTTAGCLPEQKDGTKTFVKVGPDQYDAGYTKDCFVTLLPAGSARFDRCICEPKKDYRDLLLANKGAREAQIKEPWSYRQYRFYEETNHQKGVYYSPDRYYSGRDLSGAFGANALTDYLHPNSESEAKVDPHTQIIGTFQTLCLSGIYKNLQMLKSILTGLRKCINEAKYTGLHDAGMCKTLFTQHVCGLVYKALSLFQSGCSPDNSDGLQSSGVFGDVGALISGGYSSMNQALETSVNDLKSDYGNAQLNQYFDSGAQGVAQSICLAAFGYEIPIFSKEFLMDAAYAFPSATSVLVAPAIRELSTYNPVKQTAVYRYELGGAIMPGCKIKRWSVSLKCIGPEDEGYEGVDVSCLGQGCDCLNLRTVDPGRERLIKAGFDLESGQLFDIPLESPILLQDSAFRYDHVVVKVDLDQSEKGNQEMCFDSQYQHGNQAVYYFPIKDVSPSAKFICQVDINTGKYVCPEISKEFGWGEAYLEEPYVECWNKGTNSWANCNVIKYAIGDPIRVRANINNDGKGQCLKRTVTGILGAEREVVRTLPEGSVGSQPVIDDLGTVNDLMFGSSGGYTSLSLVPGGNSGCQVPQSLPSATTLGGTKTYTFEFTPTTGSKVMLILPSEATPVGVLYSRSGQYLSKAGITEFDLTEINSVNFMMDGFQVSQVLRGVVLTDPNKRCTYQSGTYSSSSGGSNTVSVTYELLDKTGVSDCRLAEKAVKSVFGKAKHTTTIRVYKEDTSAMNRLYLAGQYDAVLDNAKAVLEEKRGDLPNALAVYYSAASYIKKGAAEGDVTRRSAEIKELLTAFFQRKMYSLPLEPYDAVTKSGNEFRIVKTYLCQVDLFFGGVNRAECVTI